MLVAVDPDASWLLTRERSGAAHSQRSVPTWEYRVFCFWNSVVSSVTKDAHGSLTRLSPDKGRSSPLGPVLVIWSEFLF